jgi:hypothetical protein
MLQDAAAVAWLGIVPGALLAALPSSGSVDRITRLALGAAFSPAVVSLTMMFALAAGSDPASTAWTVPFVSIPLAVLLLWRLVADPVPPPTALAAAFAIAVAIPVGWIAVMWLAEPGYRAFGRHNLMHADLIYQLVRLPWPPEATELAGLAMGYGWVGHGFQAALGLVSGHAPTRVFPLANMLALASTAVLLARSARQLGAGAPAAALAGALAVLTFHPTLAPAFWLGGAGGASPLVPPITKLLYLDLMPASFPLLAAIVWSVTQRETRSVWLGALAFPALALIYVAAVPAGLCLVGGVAAARLLRDKDPMDVVRWHGLPLLVGLLSLLAGTWWTPSGAAVPALLLTPAEGIASKGWDVLMGYGPWWLLALPSSWRAWRAGRPALAGLTLGGAVLATVYPFLLAKNLEYKLVIYARLAIAPALAMTLLPGPRGAAAAGPSSATRWAIAAAVTLVVAAASVPRGLARTPADALKAAVPIDESRFHLRWDDPSEGPWLEVLRAETPPETILLRHRCKVVLGAFADRSLFAPCIQDGREVAGYTLWNEANLWVFRGHPRALIRARRRILERVYRSRDANGFFEALAEVRALGRPVALHLSARDERRPRWLAERGLGREIHADPGQRLWWIPAEPAGPAER